MPTVQFTTPRCIVCGEVTHVQVDPVKLARWQSGTHIQHVWPEKTPDERELMISGTHAKCWDEMFPLEEE